MTSVFATTATVLEIVSTAPYNDRRDILRAVETAGCSGWYLRLALKVAWELQGSTVEEKLTVLRAAIAMLDAGRVQPDDVVNDNWDEQTKSGGAR